MTLTLKIFYKQKSYRLEQRSFKFGFISVVFQEGFHSLCNNNYLIPRTLYCLTYLSRLNQKLIEFKHM